MGRRGREREDRPSNEADAVGRGAARRSRAEAGARARADSEREDRPSWLEDLGPVRPLRDRGAPPPEPVRPPRAASREETPVRFATERRGETLRGLAPGVDREHLRRLARGRVPVDATLDLHGLDAAAARLQLRDACEAVRREGARCLLVVHGRGLHSSGGPVLKQALVEWLAEPPLGRQVLAFSSATPEDGGTGATYVLLRRVRTSPRR
jgi:DNA-nicking Smr family endonuclease